MHVICNREVGMGTVYIMKTPVEGQKELIVQPKEYLFAILRSILVTIPIVEQLMRKNYTLCIRHL